MEEDPQFTKTLLSKSHDGDAAVQESADAPLPETLGPGDAIGRYRIRERIGEGGMGVVYAAEDRDLGRVVAIKLLHTRYGTEAESQQHRLLREAQALARVSHRNLVMVFDVGSLHGRVWIAMEYVAGDTLEEWLAREHRSWAEIVGVLAEAGRGLAAVHAAGLVHRDFKPGNVVVRKDGTVQVLDFGLAVRVGDEEEERQRVAAAPDLDALAANLTTTGAFMGTPAYMAPEQFMMRPTDGRADQFALCVALYEALYGHRPFKGRDIAELMSRTLEGLTSLPSEMPGLPLSVRQVLYRGLQRDPDARFPDMAALVEALEATRAPARPSSGGWRRFAAGMFVGVAVLAVGVGVWLSQEDEGDADLVAPTVAPVVGTETPPKKSTKPRTLEPAKAITPTPTPTPSLTPTPSEPTSPATTAPTITEPTQPAVVEPEPATEEKPSHALPRPKDDPTPPPSTSGQSGLPGVKDREEPDEPPKEEPRPSTQVEVEPQQPDDEPPPKDPEPEPPSEQP
jgi:serine/threonine protein kinase